MKGSKDFIKNGKGKRKLNRFNERNDYLRNNPLITKYEDS
jgi:hypothetical protein